MHSGCHFSYAKKLLWLLKNTKPLKNLWSEASSKLMETSCVNFVCFERPVTNFFRSLQVKSLYFLVATSSLVMPNLSPVMAKKLIRVMTITYGKYLVTAIHRHPCPGRTPCRSKNSSPMPSLPMLFQRPKCLKHQLDYKRIFIKRFGLRSLCKTLNKIGGMESFINFETPIMQSLWKKDAGVSIHDCITILCMFSTFVLWECQKLEVLR